MATPIFKIGFTGTRNGMTENQRRTFIQYLRSLRVGSAYQFHFGDCIGSDEEAFKIVANDFSRIKTFSHPPLNSKQRAFCKANIVLPEKDYLDRNKDIVDTCNILIAVPKQLHRPSSLRGQGTWWTIVYAEQQNKEVKKLMP